MELNAITLPPVIIYGLLALGGAIIGWLIRLYTKKGQEQKIVNENERLRNIIIEYDTAAREALKYARKPKDPNADD